MLCSTCVPFRGIRLSASPVDNDRYESRYAPLKLYLIDALISPALKAREHINRIYHYICLLWLQ